MASRPRPSKSAGPIDERQRKLAEEQEKIDKLAKHLNRVIEEAPKIKAERERAQRDALLTDRGARSDYYLHSNTLVDTRYDPFAGPRTSPSRRRALKAERRQSLLIFLGLVVFLAVFVLWLLVVWHKLWPS